MNIPFDGEMDELRIWNVALTSSQINQMKNMEINQSYVDSSVPGVSWGNLAAYYQFNETSGTNLSDASSNSNDGTLYNFSVPSCWVLSDAPLPVELTSFTCTVNNRDVKLNWSTASELNNAGFEVERKPAGDGAMWTKIGFVQGNGTTNEPKNYSFEDKKLNTGKYDYRLRQIDYNNKETVFNLNNTVEVGIPKKLELSQNYPNPFNPLTKIDYNITYISKVTLKVFDITGREISSLVNETQKAGYYTVQFNASEYSSGTYFYRLTTEGGKENFMMTKRMILIK
ncbi:MAG: T9SS type A sorting domain-containing protein [Ignavibacteria bacterium]|nr:T9SS type A sorting domain-containing protein [Ignavibacteria bacterium]